MSPLLRFSLGIVAVVSAAAANFAQAPADRESRIKNFGSSLKPKEEVKTAQTAAGPAAVASEIYTIETKIVVSDFLVLDENGRAVKGLKAEDFRIFEDNTPQAIESFSLGDGARLPKSIVLIIDYSSSLLPFIETSVESAKILVDKLLPGDRMALVTDDVEVLADFTTDKKLLKEKLDLVKASALGKRVGRSLQFSALYATLNELLDDEARPIVIFQTDGDEISTLRKDEKDEQRIEMPSIRRTHSRREFSLGDILKATERTRATVYTIYPGVRYLGVNDDQRVARAATEIERRLRLIERPMPGKPQSSFLKAYAEMIARRQLIFAGIAKFTGGWDEILETPEQANDVYTRILSNINDRYVVGYYPTNDAKDGKRRTVRIELAKKSKYRVWGRKSYIAPAAR